MTINDWLPSHFHDAHAAFLDAWDPPYPHPGDWVVVLRALAQREIDRLRGEASDLPVETEAGRRLYHEARGQVLVWQRILNLKPLMERFINQEIQARL